MTVRQFAPQNATDRSIQLAQTTTVPWGQMGVSGDSARGFGLANPRGTAANPAPSPRRGDGCGPLTCATPLVPEAGKPRHA